MAPTASLPGSSQPKLAARVSASPPSPLERGAIGWLASGVGPAWFCMTSRAGRLSNDYRYMHWLVTAGFGRKLDTMEAVERVPISRFQGCSAGSNPVGDVKIKVALTS
jgi:hypothetical protein